MATSNPSIWTHFLTRYYTADIHTLATEYPDRRSLHIDFMNIEKFNPALAEELLEAPLEVLKDAGDALSSFALPVDVRLDDAHICIMHLPDLVPIRNLRSGHMSRLVAVDGLVRMATAVRPDITVAEFMCNGCGEVVHVTQSSGRFTEPYTCNSCERKGQFKLNLDKSEFVDVQRIRIQESPEDLRGGEQPQTLDIVFFDDLAGIVSPGDHVVITGVLRSYQRVTREGKSTTLDIVLEAVSIEQHDIEYSDVEISEEDEQKILKLSRNPDIYQRIIRSIAPSIYGYDDLKGGLALQLVGGVPRRRPDGNHIRGDINVLLVGDSGIAKTQLLRYIVKLAPKGIYTSGRSASASGLTAAVVKDDLGGDRWTLEAGALVLADQGIACIDELDKMRSIDRDSLHEATSIQSVSIAKAGIVATLRARCAVLAAANPKYGRFDQYEGIAQQISIAPALLSRFDLIHIVRDKSNAEQDRAVCKHILKSRCADSQTALTPEIPPDLLRRYIAYARRKVSPEFKDDATEELLIEFYAELRQQGDDADVPVTATPRQFEALIRLAEASARLRLSDTITSSDAQRAIALTRSCLEQVATDPVTGQIDIDLIEGIGKSQRDRIRLVRNTITHTAEEHGGAAPKKKVIAECVAQGIDTKYIEQLLRDLQRNGELLVDAQGLRLI